MKTIIKEKAVEIILTLLVTSVIVITGFYYNTKNDIDYLKDGHISNYQNINTLEDRMNKKDVSDQVICTKLDYITQMLEEMRK